MRKIKCSQITAAVAKLSIEANYYLPPDVVAALKAALKSETSKVGKQVISEILENARIAQAEKIPLCQDTGIAIVFAELGQEVLIVGGNLVEAINKGIRQGYQEGYLRKSVVADPLIRDHTKDNTPAVIHTEIVKGNNLKLTVCPKGAGSENMSRVAVLTPAQGKAGVKKFILETVSQAGGNFCPPGIIGVGLGGTIEKAAWLSKKALLRKVGSQTKLEKELLKEINKLGIGPLGLGGKTTALAVQIESYPCHMASLPVAVSLGCHANRHKQIIL